MNLDEIYLNISQQIIDTIDTKWTIATIDAELYVWGVHFKCTYKEDESSDIDYDFDSSFEMFKAFERLYEITTEGGKDNWNRARFTLYPSGKFNIDFKWVQSLDDEVKAFSSLQTWP